MLIIKKYMAFLTLIIIGFPLYAPFFSSTYTYYFEPLKYEKNVQVEILLREPTGKRGSSGEFLLFLYLKEFPFSKVDISSLDVRTKFLFKKQIGKKINLDVYYKINRFDFLQITPHIIPVYAFNNKDVFINKKQSISIFFNGFIVNIIFFAFFILPIYFGIKFYFHQKRD